MLKFFRKYNKLILVVGGCLLMVAFLVQGTVSQLVGGSGDYTIGELSDGTELKASQRRGAAAQLDILDQLGSPAPYLGLMADQITGTDNPPLVWLLIQEDARRMGLGASRYEVESVLAALGVDEQGVMRIAARFGTQSRVIEDAVASYGWGFSINLFGLPFHFDFAQTTDFEDSSGSFDSSFWIGRRF